MSAVFREATVADVPAVVDLLRDDVLGQGREAGEMAPYLARFHEIADDPNNALIVGCMVARIVACYQLTLIPGFTLNAMRRAEIEGVRVASDMRSAGIGEALVADAEARARAAGAGLLQLAMNRTRDAAHRFYERNGFAPSHIGFKKYL
ncbi:MAG: GNAT family N-acetyltransferase [Pseudomonadota bacterium]